MALMNKYAELEKGYFTPSRASAGECGGVLWPHCIYLPLWLMLISVMTALPVAHADEDPKTFLQFVEEFPTGVCSQRQGKAVLIKSTHLTRTIKVVLDRYNSGVGTGDRSRSVLLPSAEPEALGCSRSDVGAQEWRVVKAEFIE
jgi:hypothetical protein